MNLGNLKTLARLMVPAAKKNRIIPTNLTLILNQGTLNVAFLTSALKTNTLFNITANTSLYNLTTIHSEFLKIMEEGIWWKNSSGTWTRLKGRTIKWLDDNRPTWRNDSSGDPEFYYKEGDDIVLVPTPDTAVADGGRLYHSIRPDTMSANSDYPFGGKTEISRLSILSDAILKYWKWQALWIVGKKETSAVAEEEYKKEVTEKSLLLTIKLDIPKDIRGG